MVYYFLSVAVKNNKQIFYQTCINNPDPAEAPIWNPSYDHNSNPFPPCIADGKKEFF